MNVVVTAIVPILFLLALGALLRRRCLTDAISWGGLSWMSYWVFTPALFISSISQTDLTVIQPGALMLSLAVPTLVVAALAFVAARLTQADGPQLTSLVQGSIRINTYIGLIFASALHGQEGVAAFALASAVIVPLVNLICVSTLAVYGARDHAVKRVPLWRELIGNPLILACAMGLLLNVLPVALPSVAIATLDMLAAPALACGTLIVGAALHFTFRRSDLLHIGIVTILKLAILPAAAIAIALQFEMAGASLTSIVLICAVPTAPSAYVLASRMGGDTRLIAGTTGVQTLVALATMPIALALAGHLAS
ncbi:AEC family transporter [Leucobacter sp. UCMA 4100]|uniref:AEC family transporter n=1 Tax=Micrococcales TaxID=85006 RepID=UPI0022EAA665|nr:AEC family transporter [Leucobacter sp. UCMA 4100]MDA3147119.1 AEC family transporter [Leucobacter sp. UCMA 4100]